MKRDATKRYEWKIDIEAINCPYKVNPVWDKKSTYCNFSKGKDTPLLCSEANCPVIALNEEHEED